MTKFDATVEFNERTGEFTTYAHNCGGSMATDKDFSSAIRRTCNAVELTGLSRRGKIIPWAKRK